MDKDKKGTQKRFVINIAGTINPDRNINDIEQKFIDFVNELRNEGHEIDKAEFDE
jgi:hypothetical protein